MDASETLRRALASAEEALGPDYPLTMGILGNIGMIYALQNNLDRSVPRGIQASEAFPWLTRYLTWVEHRKGKENLETQATLEMLGHMHFVAQEYEPAQKYFERHLSSYPAGRILPPASKSAINCNSVGQTPCLPAIVVLGRVWGDSCLR
ncbi:hypothetical protein NUU61_003446 [Penicillium alfredii]|uniref:Tetratricopeptide repeat protein n=1 Tax=Penicillium alfredii TaxID=1506179 RepID=A0A9W9FTL1_9EURO|nr:uncharacterized protein NUU61_003446 [Penicillium alfredii]KAJ5106099.1 hypothetical protein NUU61_003446 [Penicillium alfredii]